MKGKVGFLIVLFLFVSSLNGVVQAQDEKIREEISKEDAEKGASLNFGADIMSRYIWRGIDLGNSPAIQPNIYFSYKGFNLGAWGSYAFSKHSIQLDDTTVIDAGNYSEMDFYLSYTFKGITLMVFDYFTMNGLNPNEGNRYFDYNNKTTAHTFEGCLSYEGPSSFPIQLLGSLLFYGEDKNKDSTGVYGFGTGNNYSLYFEAGYLFDIKKIGLSIRPFIGGIPYGSSWYGPYAGIINLGMTAKKEVEITPTYSLPLQASLVANPQAQSVFLVFGVSF